MASPTFFILFWMNVYVSQTNKQNKTVKMLEHKQRIEHKTGCRYVQGINHKCCRREHKITLIYKQKEVFIIQRINILSLI